MRPGLLALVSCWLLLACGGEQPRGTDLVDDGVTPLILKVTPGTLRVGDDLTVEARNVMTADLGQSYLRVTGDYVDDLGEKHPFDRKLEVAVVDETLLWRLWPDVVFHPQGNRMGRFTGTVRVINEGLEGSTQTSESQDVRFDVGPSLVLRALRPTRRPFDEPQAPCSDMVVPTTTEDTPLALVVEALGLTPGTPEAPLVFTWNLPPEVISLKSNVADTGDRPEAQGEPSALTVIDQTSDGTLLSGLIDASGCGGSEPSEPSWFEKLMQQACAGTESVAKTYLFSSTEGGSEVTGHLKRLATHVVSEEQADGRSQATISVTATDGAGDTASLSFPLDVYRRFTIERDSSMDRIVERDAITQVGERLPISTHPVEVRYQEASAEQKALSTGMDIDPGTRSGPGLIYAIDLSQALSGDILSTGPTSAKRTQDLSQSVPPGQCVTFYRQAEKVRRFARVTRHSACGETTPSGNIFLDDWQWQREIATNPECPAPSVHLNAPGPCLEDCDTLFEAPSMAGDFWN